MLRILPTVMALAVLGGLVACRSDETIARQNFGSRFTCPDERITVARRPDLNSIDLAFRPEAPPTEVAEDPDRLALWKKEQARRADRFADKAVIHATGCGRELFFVCGQLHVSVGTTRYLCADASYPPTGQASPAR